MPCSTVFKGVSFSNRSAGIQPSMESHSPASEGWGTAGVMNSEAGTTEEGADNHTSKFSLVKRGKSGNDGWCSGGVGMKSYSPEGVLSIWEKSIRSA